MSSFQKPERKDRSDETHGGVIVYVKDTISYVRRFDLELKSLECIWIQLKLSNKSVLFGVFYRPPSAHNIYNSQIEDSITLAPDTGIKNIIVTGDLNYNALKLPSSRKVQDICQQFNLSQIINEPTHFTETSASLIDLLFTTDQTSVIASGVSDPFLNQDIRYHCPVYAIFKYTKPRQPIIERRIWKYENGDYTRLKLNVSQTNLNLLADENVDAYANTFKVGMSTSTRVLEYSIGRPSTRVPFRYSSTRTFSFFFIAFSSY